jgi:serine/threonine protein kinase
MIGTTIQDRYTVEKKIGEGGFASVFRGMHTKLKRPVAIKVLKDEFLGNEAIKQRFLREAESMAQLSHPNLVTVYDQGEHNGVPYFIMEYVNGPNLLDLVNNTTLTLAQICHLAMQTCDGMAYAHKQGVIHRDLTLKNIMIAEGDDKEQQVKVLDFGLAKVLSDEVQSSGKDMIGTYYYLSPEQLRNEEIDPRVDIFAFGVGLHRIVNGEFPFYAEHPAALMYLILNEFDIKFKDEVPQGMKDLILNCLEKDARSRVADFDEVKRILNEIRMSSERIANPETIGAVSHLGAYAHRSSKRNPYLNRVMIKNISDFFGRAREIRRIYSRLDAPHPQSISVVGERRIGKSSLLNHIYQSRQRRAHMTNNDNAIFVYLDFQQDAEFDVTKFIDFLFNMFSYESKNGKDYTKREKTLDNLKQVIQELQDEGKRIIILMDEFETITNNDRFSEQFFSYLRALANSYRVAYVTSSYKDLQDMCHNQDISDSPFFNIFSNLQLRPFTKDEAMELIVKPSEMEGVPLEPHAGKILELSGTFPLFLQVACSNVFEFLVDHEDSEPNWADVTKMFTSEVEAHYRHIWDHMDEPARDNLARIAEGKPINKKFKFINEDLERRGYIVETSSGLDLCSSSFKDFVRKSTGSQAGGFLGGIFRRRG